MSQPDNEFISPEERGLLAAYAAGNQIALARRAQIILGWAGGQSIAEIASVVGASDQTVRKWLREFEAMRLAIFPDQPLNPLEQTPEPISITVLCRQYNVDIEHGVRVGKLARDLLTTTAPLHNIHQRYYETIYYAGLLHNVAMSGGAQAHHTRGRDILLKTPLTDLNEIDRTLIAAATAFHRKAWKDSRLSTEPAYLALTGETQQAARWLSALVRIADGLDYSQSQTTSLVEAKIDRGGCLIVVNGPHVESDAARADQKADMWRAVTGIPLSVISLAEHQRRARLPHIEHKPAPPVLLPTDPMDKAGRSVLRFHLERLLYYAGSTGSGEGIEAVHKMRVATRRLRAALRVFGPFFDAQKVAKIRRGLANTAETLGAVRDLDVLIEHAQRFRQTLDLDQQIEFDNLLSQWHKHREKLQSRLGPYLHSDQYENLVTRLVKFTETDQPAAKVALVGHTVPSLIYQRYQVVRAYEPSLQGSPVETLHALRIDVKRLRYVLEFFQDALGPEASEVIQTLTGVQDYLGALQDAEVASMLIRKYVRGLASMPEASAVAAYLRMREDELRNLHECFGPLYEGLVSIEMRQQIARAICIL